MVFFHLFLACAAFTIASALKSSTPNVIDACCSNRSLTYFEEWDYYHVRQDANLFYWLYYEKPSTQVDGTRPLLLWHQGGPGLSSAGHANFQMIGPLDVDLKPRSTTWLSRTDLLFVDSPVGTGYSFVTNDSALARTVEQAAADLVNFTVYFMNAHPEYKTRPFYVVGECFGAKITTVYAWRLSEAIRQGRIQMNFRGVGLQSAWVSPIDSTTTWADYLHYFSFVSPENYADLRVKTDNCTRLIQNGEWELAALCYVKMLEYIGKTYNVNWYNVMSPISGDTYLMPAFAEDDTPQEFLSDSQKQIKALMDGPIRQRLGIVPKTIYWYKSKHVGVSMISDFMEPVVNVIDDILNNTNIVVFIFNGQLDLIVPMPAVDKWMNKLQWSSMEQYRFAKRSQIFDRFGDNQLTGYLQSYSTLYRYWAMRAGHLVPQDAPTGSLAMLDLFLQA